MYTASELERASMSLDEPMKELENSIMSDIIRRIKENGEITASADWQINRLAQLGVGMDEISAAINQALDATENITDTLFTDVIKSGYASDASLYKAVGKVQIPFNDNRPLQQLISFITAQTNETLHNITQSLGFAQRDALGHLSFTPLADYYQKTLDGAMLDIASGAFSYDQVLKRTVKSMTDSGLRTVDYATGWSNRVDVTARRAVMTGMTQLTAKVNEQNAEQLDTEWFEISWHSGARPSHWWGGKWYTKEQLTSICKLGDVQGLCGANCYHDYSPVIPGISEPTYSAEELAEMERQEKEPIEYNGKQYTKYEALQRQRRLETTMRAQRQEMKLLKEGGVDEDDLINCRARYMGTSHEYAQFSKAMGLSQQRERVYGDGLGNIMQGRYKGGSGKESPVSVPKVGAKREGKVTAEERKELLSRNAVDVHNSSVDKSGGSGIIEPKIFYSGDEVNDFFYYDGEERGLAAKESSSYGKWLSSLSDEEKRSLRFYTSNGYIKINGILRQQKEWKGTSATIRNIDKAISSFELKEDITVYRGVRDFYGASIVEVNEWNDIRETVGKTFLDLGFGSSTALNGNSVATSKPFLFEIEIPAGKGRGAYINRLSSGFEDDEYEFLIARNSKFRIIDVYDNNEPIPPQKIIKMRMIVDEKA